MQRFIVNEPVIIAMAVLIPLLFASECCANMCTEVSQYMCACMCTDITSGRYARLRGARLTRACAPTPPPPPRAQSCNNALGVAVAMPITFFKRMKRA